MALETWLIAVRTSRAAWSMIGFTGGAGEETSVERTIRRTPAVMRRMTATSRTEKRSSLRMKAKKRTKMSEDDLHIATRVSSFRVLSDEGQADLLYRDNVIVLRLRLERPISRPVAMPHGTHFFLQAR